MSDKKRVHQGKNNDVLERIQWNRSNLPSIASNSLSLSMTIEISLSFFFFSLLFPPPLLHFANYYFHWNHVTPFFLPSKRRRQFKRERRWIIMENEIHSWIIRQRFFESWKNYYYLKNYIIWTKEEDPFETRSWEFSRLFHLSER